jgi:hypothetical protein
MPSRRAISEARRVRGAVVRLESLPRDYGGQVRGPRLGGASGHLWVQPTTTIAAATGAWGSQTPGTLTGQTIYSTGTGVQVALQGAYKVVNWWPTSVVAGKTTLLLPNGNGSFDVAEWSC